MIRFLPLNAEILRDYGFLEPFPQVWHYLVDTIQFELDLADDGGFNLTWMHDLYPQNDYRPDDRPRTVVWLRRQIRRLQRIRNVDYRAGNPGMPEHEWNLAWEFQKANIQAMTVAASYLEAMENGVTDEAEMRKLQSAITLEQFERDYSHYDPLEWEVDDVEYTTQLCDNADILRFEEHVPVETIKTHYQNVAFSIHPKTRDVVLDLDSTLQIASNYRPQYHEFMIHAAARFLPKVERVIFIGGGDSMLLHELLKYPDLKLVVGLELDQTVVRKSFRYFRSSPHFEDPRVEWWFGDATKSLLLLSQEYWQSFDLVLVDLSETVMSFSVTSQLDVFDALALLLTPDGIMVKNELYMEPMSGTFDYSMDIIYESPVICSQVQVFGSNKVHFLHDPVYDHGIDAYLYNSMHDPITRNNLAHNFRVNNATKQEKCGQLPVLEKLDEQSRSAGIMEIVEVEQVSVALDGSLEDIFLQVIQREGFRPIAAPIFVGGLLLIVMKEGYVLTRMFPEEKYCSLDISLWGRFDKLSVLRKSLTDKLGSGLISRFRVVVGGMYGSDTWTEDRDIIGPQLVQSRNCEIPAHGEALDVTEDLITAAFMESLTLAVVQNITAIVVCRDTEDCLATKLLDKTGIVQKAVKVSACPTFASDDIDAQYVCEIRTTQDIKSQLSNDIANLVVVDASTPFEMFQIMNSILSRDDFRKSSIRRANLMMAWTTDAEKEEYQRFFLDRRRKQEQAYPISRAEILMQVGTKAVEFGIIATEDKHVFHHFAEIESRLRDKFKDFDNVQIELRGIFGGQYQNKFLDEPIEFLQSDYDNAEDYHHYFNQKPLACHTIFQLEEVDDETAMPKESLNIALVKALHAIRLTCTTQQSFTGMGEGGVIMCVNPAVGNAVVVWDGRKHLDISLYLLGDAEQVPNIFLDTFLRHVDNKLKVALRDDMPRGIGRIINFPSDILTPEELQDFYDSLPSRVAPTPGDGEEEEDDDDDDDAGDEFEEIADDEDYEDDDGDDDMDDEDDEESSVDDVDNSLGEL